MSRLPDVAPAIRAAAERALALDPSLPDAHSPLGFLAGILDYDWKEAARRFELATSTDSASPLSYLGFGWAYFLGSGQRKEAVEQLQRAVQADPLHLTYRAMLAMALGAWGRYGEAEELLRQSLALDPNFFWSYSMLTGLYAARGMFMEARPVAEKAFALAPWDPPTVGLYAGVLARTSDRVRAVALLDELGPSRYGAPAARALFHTACGEIDPAADWFEKAIEERYSIVPGYLQSAICEPLRKTARWPRLAALMNLPVGGFKPRPGPAEAGHYEKF
jgi:tetratricopeptide (TPR) repeat protein